MASLPHRFLTQDNEVLRLTEKVAQQSAAFSQDDSKARKELMINLRKLYLQLETPMEAILRMEWAELARDQGQPKSSAELSALTVTDQAWLNRILKHMSSMGVIMEMAADTYAPTRLSDALTEPKYRDGILFCYDIINPGLQVMHKFQAKNKYKNPSDPANSPFQTGHQTDLHLFEYLKQHKDDATHFNNHMSGYTLSRARWMEPGCVPVQRVLEQDPTSAGNEDGVLLIDVGGGIGHDMELFQKYHSKLPGRLILQELPSVIEAATTRLPKGIESMEYDFFTPQPIKGAKAYYMHSVLHDWPDAKCLEILANLTPAMTKGYSKLLINENVIPDLDAHWQATGLDIIMMTLTASTERTARSWSKLLADAGLRIVKIWNYEMGSESLIEAELA